MKILTVNILVSLMIILGSCNSKKEISSKHEESKQIQVILEKEGFSLGTIVRNLESECTYIIIDNKSGLKYDPINIDDDRFKLFKVDEKEVYFKFRPLRRMNRCENIQPVEVEDMKEK